MDFFNNQMNMAGMAGSEGNAIISSQVNLDKNFAFLEVGWLRCFKLVSQFLSRLNKVGLKCPSSPYVRPFVHPLSKKVSSISVTFGMWIKVD